MDFKTKISRIILVSSSLLGLAFFALSSPVKAANPLTVPLDAAKNPINFSPEVPIPGTFDKPMNIDSNSIARYIRAIYIYFIWGVGILATVMIVYGGVRWVAAAGNAARINDARETVNNAIIGLIIALTSYALLYIINPELLNLKLPDIGTVNSHQLSFQNGCIQNLACPDGYSQTLGAYCSGGTFGAVSGSFKYANPGDNICGNTGGTQYGICCHDNQTGKQCVGISSVDGSSISGQCNTDVTVPIAYSACSDQTPCGQTKSLSSTSQCIGVNAGTDKVCYPQFTTKADGTEVPSGTGVAIPGGSAGGSYIFSGIKKCTDAGKGNFKLYFDATIACGQSQQGNTPDGVQTIWGTKQSCQNGQFCALLSFGNQCELIGPRTGCSSYASNPLP